MTEEASEKRFHSVMDKLFHTPKSKSVSRNQSSRGKKRGNSVLGNSNGESNDSGRDLIPRTGLKRSGSLASSSSETVLCRPWHRGDLMRRLSTFKSMTWFGKPKVVSAVNCARRGWINVEMDIIACEACGSRVLFSNPLSWTQQQIEKAAAVFSLKLDNGHKLTCPWIGNVCDESLAQFPPTPAPVLIDGYNERSAALLHLSALPVITTSAIDHMRSPQLERFLKQLPVDVGNGSIDATRIEYRGHEREASSHLYYQALKLISLCGWEPRSLSYAVDLKDWSAQAAENGPSEERSPRVVSIRNPGVVMYLTSGVEDVMDVGEDTSHNGLQSDPASVVLDCKFCGATAGLWAFSTVPRPLELFKVVESVKVNGVNCQNDSGNSDGNVVGCIAEAPGHDGPSKDLLVGHNEATMGIHTPSKEKSLNLNLSIAGGPPPAKQNYRATVSLPIISRHLRADFSGKSDVRNHLMSNVSSMDHEKNECNSVNTTNDIAPCKLIFDREDMGTLVQENNEDGLYARRGEDESRLNGYIPSRNDKKDATSSEQGFVIEKQVPSRHALETCSDSHLENPVESSQKMPHNSGGNYENVASTGSAETAVENGSQDEVSIRQFPEVPSEAGEAATSVSSSLEANAIVDVACTMDLQKDNTGSSHQKLVGLQGTNEEVEGVKHTMQLTVCNEEGSNQKVKGVKNTMQLTVNNEKVAAHDFDPKWVQFEQPMEFDPIRQHRHFCPWIVSTGKTGPGWRETLYAIDHEKASSLPSLTDSPSSSMFEIDNPIPSLRNLLESPSTKRIKTSHN